MGKAIMAYLSPDEVDAVLGSQPLPQRTPNTITDRARLAQNLLETRERGYSIDLEEFEDGLRCVGAAVFDHTGRAVAAISISGPRHRVTDEAIPALGHLVRESASKISARLGAPRSAHAAPELAAG
jgi:IclR family acetate operon transcriptional repressor